MDTGTDNVLVAGIFKQLYVAFAHQTSIYNYNEIIKRETLYEVVYDGNHGVTFILLAVEYAVGKRVTISAHE